jgi:peptidoglycan/LPS O-acetylase OafA/YrhL
LSVSRQAGTEGHGSEAAHEAAGGVAHKAERNRIDDIEILRAVAVVFVLMEHARGNLFFWMDPWAPSYFGFWNGVDLFFAISGFVIARSLMPNLTAARNTTKFLNVALAFWVRRAWRLLPSAWLWLVVILVAAIFFNTSGAFGSVQSNFECDFASLLDMENWRVTQIFTRFEPGAAFPYWSLSLEEQFYILFPFLILISGKRLPFVVGAGILLQMFIQRSGAGTTYIGLLLNQFRTDALFLGVLVAIWSKHPTYRLFEPTFLKKRPWRGMALFAVLVFILAITGSPTLHLLGGFQVGFVALLCAVFVIIASYDSGYFTPRGPIKHLMLWFGSRSYALYLIHIPTYFLTREIWFRLQPAGTIFTDRFTVRFTYTAAILLLIFVELNYRFVEVPLRRRGARISKRIAARDVTVQEHDDYAVVNL